MADIRTRTWAMAKDKMYTAEKEIKIEAHDCSQGLANEAANRQTDELLLRREGRKLL
jgi:hypothetical protein